MKNTRAQASLEFLILLAISITIITVIVLLAQEQMGTVQMQKQASDARNSLLDISAAAKEVYAQGEGSKKQVYIQLPSGYGPNESFVANRSIRIRADGTDYVSLENFDVHGSLPGTPGGHWVWVISEGNRVTIGLAMLELNRNYIYVMMDRNSTAAASFSVKNIWGENISVATVTIWTTPDVALGGVPSAFQIDSGAANLISLEFTSDPASGGVYSGEIELDATDGMGSTDRVTVPITVVVMTYGEDVPLPGEDILGPIIINIYQIPTPVYEWQSLAIIATATDAQTGNNTIKSCDIDVDQNNSWKVMTPVDGAYDQPTEAVLYNYSGGFAKGPHGIRARCTDAVNNTGPTAYYYFNVSGDEVGPIVTFVNHTAYPTTLSNVSVSGIATEIYTGNSNIRGCQVKVDTGTWRNATAADGAYDSPTENFAYNIGPMAAGYHTAYFRCTDALGNVGGIYNDTFGVVDVDLMLVLDKSGSMESNVTDAANSSVANTTNTAFTLVKTLTVTTKNGDLANLTTEISANISSCTASYEARVSGAVVARGNRTGTGYGVLASSVNISNYTVPFQVALYMKRNSSSACTASNRLFSLQQLPRKLTAAQTSAKIFVDIVSNTSEAGLVSYSTNATTDKTLANMTPSNKQALKNAIDAITPVFTTCIECGLHNGADELVSARARPTATKVIVLLTDGMGNACVSGASCGSYCTSCSVTGAEYCRDRNITVYTIGFGGDVDETELTDIAMLTHGKYYFAPDAATLTEIFENIGK